MIKIFKGKDVSGHFYELVLKHNSAYNSIYSIFVILPVKTQTVSLHVDNSNDPYFKRSLNARYHSSFKIESYYLQSLTVIVMSHVNLEFP